MADVPLRHRQAPSPWRARWLEARAHLKPLVVIAAAVVFLVGLGGIVREAIRTYSQQMKLTGLTADTTPVAIVIAGERLTIPANMLRLAAARAGGTLDRADLALLWPGLSGYSDDRAEAFAEGAQSPEVIYATIAPRDSDLDSTGRLDSVYARLFAGRPVGGPAGLVGRTMRPGSGYDGEIVYFDPIGPTPFVARCPQKAAPELPATCIRDVHFGRGLGLLYRFDSARLADWRELDRAFGTLTARLLRP
jgi:hypothetical protein